MAQTSIETSAKARSLVLFKFGLVVNKPLSSGDAVTVTLVDQVLIEGHVILDTLEQEDAVDHVAIIASGTGEDHRKLVERCHLQLLVDKYIGLGLANLDKGHTCSDKSNVKKND